MHLYAKNFFLARLDSAADFSVDPVLMQTHNWKSLTFLFACWAVLVIAVLYSMPQNKHVATPNPLPSVRYEISHGVLPAIKQIETKIADDDESRCDTPGRYDAMRAGANCSQVTDDAPKSDPAVAPLPVPKKFAALLHKKTHKKSGALHRSKPDNHKHGGSSHHSGGGHGSPPPSPDNGGGTSSAGSGSGSFPAPPFSAAFGAFG
jgi:uncharacterized membrane protein YgcG